MNDLKFYPAGYSAGRHESNMHKSSANASVNVTASISGAETSDLNISKNPDWLNSTTIPGTNGLQPQRSGEEFIPGVNGLAIVPSSNQCRCQSCVLFKHFSKKADNKMLEFVYHNIIDHWKTQNEFYLNVENDHLYEKDPRNVISKVKSKQMKVNDTIVLKKPEESLVSGYSEAIESLNLLTTVVKALKDMRFEQMRPIQYYCWPHVLRFENMAIVGRPKCGKTLAYLVPVMCAVFDRIDTADDEESAIFSSNFRRIADMGHEENAECRLRPMVLIVCENVTDVFRQLKQLTAFKSLKPSNMAHLLSPVRLHHTPGYFRQRNGAVIVVATIEAIAEALDDRSLDISALQTCVFESWHSFSPFQIQSCEEILQSVHRHESDNNVYLQYIATTELWSPRFRDFMKKHAHGMVVECYESGIEACASAATRFQFCMCEQPNQKRHKIVELLKKCTENDRIVIAASEDDVAELEELRSFLAELEVACDALIDETDVHTMSKHNVQLVRDLWKRRQPQRRILLCTDRVLRILMIRTATVLVHYSMPGLWSTFEHRHTALGYCVQNALASNVYTILRTDDFRDIYALGTFCRRFGTKRSSQKLAKIASQTRRAVEAYKHERKYVSCASIFEFGVCVSRSYHSDCKRAHRFDTTQNANYALPDSGLIRYRIVRMIAPNHFFAHFVSDSDPDCKFLHLSNQIKRQLDDFKHLYDFEPTSLRALTEKNEKCALEAGQVYGYLMDNDNTLVRVKVVSVGHRVVDVLLIDHGIELYNVARRNLITLTVELAELQPTLVELYIANIQPRACTSKRAASDMRDYCPHCTFNLQRDLDAFPTQSHYYRSNVLYRYENVLWVDEMDMLQTKNESISFSIRSFLLANQIAEENCTLLPAIRRQIEKKWDEDAAEDVDVDDDCVDIDSVYHAPTGTDAISTVADDYSDCCSNGGQSVATNSSVPAEYAVPNLESLAIVTMLSETNGPCKPEMDWTQTDMCVTIRFRVREPICNIFELDHVTRQSFRFRSSTRASINEFYDVQVRLFAQVDDKRRNERFDAYKDLIEVELFKLETGVFWPRLTETADESDQKQQRHHQTIPEPKMNVTMPVETERSTSNNVLLTNGHGGQCDNGVLGGSVPEEYMEKESYDSDYTDSVFSDD